jgi:hypothetical protein
MYLVLKFRSVMQRKYTNITTKYKIVKLDKLVF